MRFLIDENIHHKLAGFLTRLGHDVKFSPKGLKNGKVLAEAVAGKRILITHDSDFAMSDLKFSGHSGIVLVKIPPEDIELIQSGMKNLLLDKPAPKLFKNKFIQLFENRYEF